MCPAFACIAPCKASYAVPPQPLLVTCPGTSPETQKYWWDLSSKPNPRWHRGARAICATHIRRQRLPGREVDKWPRHPDPLIRVPHARTASHRPSGLDNLLHSSYFATAGKVRRAVAWKGASRREQGQQTEMWGCSGKRGERKRKFIKWKSGCCKIF